MKMKKVLAMILVICLAMAIGVGATLAYLKDDASVTNVFTVGNVTIELTEPEWEKTGKEEAKEVYGGEALAKDPTVTNVGANPCFVRISVTGLDCLGNAGMITYKTDYVLNALGNNWVKHTDDFFYYTKPLAVGETTDALFDQIVIPTGVTNANGNVEYNIVVNAYAVQAQGAKPSYTAVQAMTVEEIAAWFTTCGF